MNRPTVVPVLVRTVPQQKSFRSAVSIFVDFWALRLYTRMTSSSPTFFLPTISINFQTVHTLLVSRTVQRCDHGPLHVIPVEIDPFHHHDISSIAATMEPSSTPHSFQSQCPYYRHAVALLFIVPALGGLLFGYDIGATSFAIVQLMGNDEKQQLSGTSFTLNNAPLQTGMVVSAPSFGALLGTAVVFVIAESIGRRLELRCGGFLYVIGTVMAMMAARISMGGLALALLIVARIIYGTGIGFAMHAAPAYLGEVMPPSIRGAVVSGKEVFIVTGILLGYVIGYAFKEEYRGWIHTYAVTLIPAFFMVTLSYYIPYSPRWLVTQGRDEEAKQALLFLWKPDQATMELDSMVEARRERQGNNQHDTLQPQTKKGSFEILCSVPKFRTAMVAGIGLVVLQQITGQPSVLSYATPILMSAGLSSYASVVVAFFKVLATLLAVFLVERSGRRKLLMVGCSLMLIALIILTITFHRSSYTTNSSASDDRRAKAVHELDVRSLFTLFGMFVYIAGYQVGFGPITWLIISEVFPQSIRGPAVALVVQMNFLINAVVQFGVPILEQEFGLSFMFGTFAMLTAYSIYFVYTNVPETRGLTLEEIEEKFGSMAGGGTTAAPGGRYQMDRVGSDDEKVQLIATA